MLGEAKHVLPYELTLQSVSCAGVVDDEVCKRPR